MEQNGEHKRDKATFIYWAFIGISLGIVIGASTSKDGANNWAVSLIGGLVMGLGMAFMATKQGVDQ